MKRLILITLLMSQLANADDSRLNVLMGYGPYSLNYNNWGGNNSPYIQWGAAFGLQYEYRVMPDNFSVGLGIISNGTSFFSLGFKL